MIRHGESEWNAAHRYSGQLDIPLSPLGQKQALCLAERLATEPLAAIYSSPLRRAHHTALALADRKRLPVHLDDNLMEIRHGLWQGLTVDQVTAQFADDYSRWRTQPTQVVMPQGESLLDLARRVQDFQRVIGEQREGALAICSHDAVLRVLTLSLLGLALEHFWKFSFENASLTILDSINSANCFRLTTLNDTTHLNGIRSDHATQAL